MATFEITGPDGKKYRVSGETPEGAHAALMKHLGKGKPQSNIPEQAASGFNEGLANLAGAPVDMATSWLNMAGRVAGEMADIPDLVPQIDPETAVGGSASLRQVMDPVISDAEPEGMGQRFARRVGQEVGAAAIPAGALSGRAMRAGESAGRYLATQGLGATGAGVGAQTAQEVRPGDPIAEIVGQLAGGAAGAASIGPRVPRAPTIEEVRRQQSDAYRTVDQSTARLTPQGRDMVVGDVQAAGTKNAIDARLHPKAAVVSERVGELGQTPTIAEVEEARRLVSRNVAGSLDPEERRIGKEMRDALDGRMSDLAQNAPPEAQEAFSALQTGRDATSRIKKYEMLMDALDRADLRAASTGTGGNTINAQRQNVRAILDNPKKRRGFSAEEQAAMEDFVRGTGTQNFMRLLGRLSPTAGALPLMGNIGAVATTGGATGSPAMTALAAGPMMVGMGAKATAEALASRQAQKIAEMILRGAPVDTRKLTEAQKATVAALVAGGAANGFAPQ